MKNWHILLLVVGALAFSCVESGAAGKNILPLYQVPVNAASFVDLEVTLAGEGKGKVTSNPAGIDCGTTCSKRLSRNQKVTLTVSWDKEKAAFAGWSGSCSGTASTCTLTMDKAKKVTANFIKKTLVRETGIWWGLHNGGRPTFYYTHYMRDYPPTFKLVMKNCETVTVINNGHRFESNNLIAKQSDVGGRGMAVTTQSGKCLGSRSSYLEYYKEDMPRQNSPVLIP